MSLRVLSMVIGLWWVLAVSAAGQDLIFADGFESGDLSAWSIVSIGSTTPPCVVGLPVSGALAGDLGPSPPGSFDDVTCVEIRNDRPFERSGEVAFAGIPMPANLNLTSTDGLVLIGPGGRRLASQFDVLSRWGGPMGDTSRPIRWLEVSVMPQIAADDSAVYALRRYDVLAPAVDPFAATISPSGAMFEVDTGVATFTLDPSNPALFQSITIDAGSAADGARAGQALVYTHSPGAGPRMVTNGGTVLDTSTAGQVVVDPDSFAVVEQGPVKVVVMLRGHFSAGSETLCTAITPAYERFGFTVVATLHRASRDVHLQLQFRNECSDAMANQWLDDAVTVQSMSWQLPMDAGLPGAPTAYYGGSGALVASAAGFTGITVVEQRKGAGSPWVRRARVMRDAATLETAEQFEQPFVAVSDGNLVASAQMPWMRYREPQALAIDNKTLSLQLISEPLVMGEGRGIWNFAKLSFDAVGTDSGGLEVDLQQRRDRDQAELERGLLVRAPRDHVNASGLYASLGTGSGSPLETYYRNSLELIHGWTVDPGGQWDRAKTFGSQIWPDVQFDQWSVDGETPANNAVRSNYWNPSGAELFEFLRTGEPQWVWDFAMPQSWRHGFSAFLNMGERSHGNRNGLSVAGTGTGEGHWNRDGFSSSDDYNYNMGMQLAYAIRPNVALRDRFAQAGRTVVDRYNIPQADQATRDPFVNGVNLQRGQIQHFEHLANCAEFVPGALGASCHDKLIEIVTELTSDNLSSGVQCGEDIPAPNPCSTPQQFMLNGHIYHFFHRIDANYGDLNGLLRRALIESPQAFYTWAIPKLGDGTSIDIATDWPNGMDCDLSADRTTVNSCVGWVGGEPTYFENRPHTVALLLMAHQLDPSIGLCQISRQALDALVTADAFSGYMSNNAGWWKGSAQMMQGMVFAIGGDDLCSD